LPFNKKKPFRKRLKHVSNHVLSTDLLYLDETGFNLYLTINSGYSPANVNHIRHDLVNSAEIYT